MVDSRFDRDAFASRLATRVLGRALETHAEVGSTNDVAWDALAEGGADGLAIVADTQTRGRGRAGRIWHTTPVSGLALSVLLRDGCDRRPLAALPLAAGLALALALERLGVAVALKWPNDVLLSGGKLAGILCESRGAPGRGGLAVVIGVGVNVAQREEDFPPELRGVTRPATSLALEGHALSREAVAAEFLNALEAQWAALEANGAADTLEAWRRRAPFWGQWVRLRTPAGPIEGVARGLDEKGGLILAHPDGAHTTVLAGVLESAVAGEDL